MLNRRFLIGGALCAGSATLVSWSRPREAANRSLRIGVAMSLTGALRDEGSSLLNAALMAAEELSGSGQRVSNRALEILSVDDRGEDAEAPQAARDLIAQRPCAVIGHLTCGASAAAAPVYSRAGIPLLTTATSPRVSEAEGDLVFRLVASDVEQGAAIARWAAELLSGERLAMVDDGSIYGAGLAGIVSNGLRARGVSHCPRFSFTASETDFGELMAAVRARSVTAVIIAMDSRPGRALLRRAAALGLSDFRVLGSDRLKAGRVPLEAGRLRALLVTSPVIDTHELGAPGQRFREQYRARFTDDPADAAHYVYDAVHVLAQAAAGSDLSPAGLALRLRDVDPAVPVTGYMRFDRKGEARFAAVGLYAARSGQWNPIARETTW